MTHTDVRDISITIEGGFRRVLRLFLIMCLWSSVDIHRRPGHRSTSITSAWFIGNTCFRRVEWSRRQTDRQREGGRQREAGMHTDIHVQTWSIFFVCTVSHVVPIINKVYRRKRLRLILYLAFYVLLLVLLSVCLSVCLCQCLWAPWRVWSVAV